MNHLIELYNIAEDEDLTVKEYPLEYNLKGLYKNNKIIIKKGMSNIEVKCVLAEEIGHHYLTVGNIIDENKITNKKQEKLARKWAYHKLIPVDKLKKGIQEGNKELYNLAEYLEVTEDFLKDALEEYTSKKLITNSKEVI